MKSVLYLGCPSTERADTEKLLADANVSVVWADKMVATNSSNGLR